ncbi:hypothetical protein COLO4_36221 [Corchorus olitorius]|uniref:Uncharacterized protein n=1 Tax=Corchorus olitorius TaxID=93759 RepID=A0A1R3GAD2_9ROSI|nr:hypothetical protein COLO4_36221 [Corchorus olitorius]
MFIFFRRSFITDYPGSAERPIEIPEDVVDWTKVFSELSDDSDIKVLSMSVTDDSQDLSRTISIGVESPPSREEGGSPEIPLIRKRKAVGVAEASRRPKAARQDTSDPIFSDLSPLSQPKSSHSISVGELGNMEVGSSHVGDVARSSPLTVGVAIIEVVEGTFIVNGLGEEGREFLPRGGGFVEKPYEPPVYDGKDWYVGPSSPTVVCPPGPGNHGRGKGLMTLNALAEAQGRPGFPMSTLMSEIESPYGVLPCLLLHFHCYVRLSSNFRVTDVRLIFIGAGNLNKDLEDMDPKVLAERRAKQNARHAGLVAPTSSVVSPPTSALNAPKTSQANPALTLAQVRPQGSHPGECSAQGAVLINFYLVICP